MPTFRELMQATGASRFLIRAIVEELDPDCEHRKKIGKSWVVDDALASQVASEAAKRADNPKVAESDTSALKMLEDSHRREVDAIRNAYEAELRASDTVSSSLREVIAERERTIDGLRAEVAALKADISEMRDTIANITGARWYTRAFNIRRLLPGSRS